MKIRAVIFDVYGTLLHVGPGPTDAAERWRWLWESCFGRRPRLTLKEFLAAAEERMAREHVHARERGIGYPEVYWPEVLEEIAPEVRNLPRDARRGFELAHARLTRTTALMPGAAPVLRLLIACGVVPGIAANAQPHTIWEMEEALAGVGLGNDVFKPDAVFWSFRYGFAKPDPHVFQLLTARLRARGIEPEETLMVGDRAETDLEPARACGWRTFHLTSVAEEDPCAGDWQTLAAWLDGRLPN